jgi:pimeloyl-ACP methyl ester carboxylesterase
MAEPSLEPIIGRYLHLTLQGRAHRLYFEEAGQGIPLVCLHTAGSDSCQFRHLMTDTAITPHFRVVAFDMPRHGKSLPPVGWQDEEYRLTTTAYVELIRTFSRALGLQRPVVLGCSIGGKIVLHLARKVTVMKELGHFPMSEHPERFRQYILPVLEEIRALKGP